MAEETKEMGVNVKESEVKQKPESDNDLKKENDKDKEKDEKKEKKKADKLKPELDTTIEDYKTIEGEFEKFEPISDKHYKHMGFYCAIEHVENPFENLNALIQDLKSFAEERVSHLKSFFKNNDDRIKSKLGHAEKKLTSDKEILDKYKSEIEDLKKERESILTELDSLKKNIHEEFKKLANAKKDLIENRLKNRLNEINEELNKLLKNYQLLSEKKSDTNKKIFNDNKDSLIKKVQRFEALKKQIEEAYRLIRKKLSDLNDAGFTEGIFTFLNYVGYISLAAAGWFFSIFVADKNIQSQDYVSFIFSRIFAFGSEIFSEGSKFFNVLIMLGGLLGILFLITLIIWGTDWLIRKRRGNMFEIEQLFVEVDEDSGLFHFAPLYSNTLLISWLNALPPIFIIGLIFILLSLFGTNPPHIENLMTSLSGQFIGAAIALAVTGIMIFYITKVIEPRLLNKDKNDNSIKSILINNWELVFSISLFIIMITLILIIRDINNSTIALLGFFIITLFTAFTLGYGLKYRGLVNVGNRLEMKIRNLSYAIEDNSRPKSLDTKSIESKIFRKKFENCQDDFFRMIIIRNQLVEELLSDRIRKPNVLFSRLKNYLDKKGKPNLEVRELSSIEEKYFPEYKQIIDDLKAEWNRMIKKYDEVQKEIKQIKTGESDFENKILKQIRVLENKIDNFKKALSHYEKVYNNKVETIKLWREKCETDLKDGFDLGLWYRKKNRVKFKEEIPITIIPDQMGDKAKDEYRHVKKTTTKV